MVRPRWSGHRVVVVGLPLCLWRRPVTSSVGLLSSHIARHATIAPLTAVGLVAAPTVYLRQNVCVVVGNRICLMQCLWGGVRHHDLLCEGGRKGVHKLPESVCVTVVGQAVDESGECAEELHEGRVIRGLDGL